MISWTRRLLFVWMAVLVLLAGCARSAEKGRFSAHVQAVSTESQGSGKFVATYLPAGFWRNENKEDDSAAAPAILYSQFFTNVPASGPVADPPPDSAGFGLTAVVGGDYPDLNELASEPGASWITVRGQPGVLRIPNSARQDGAGLTSLVWMEHPNVSVALISNGTSADVLMKVADGLKEQ